MGLGIWSLSFWSGVWNLEFGVLVLGSRIKDLLFIVEGLGLRFHGLRIKFRGSEFKI